MILSAVSGISRTVKYVSDSHSTPLGVYEHFIKFMKVDSSTREDLYKTLLNLLKELNLNVKDIRSQEYDNCSNMQGQISEVQDS